MVNLARFGLNPPVRFSLFFALCVISRYPSYMDISRGGYRLCAHRSADDYPDHSSAVECPGKTLTTKQVEHGNRNVLQRGRYNPAKDALGLRSSFHANIQRPYTHDGLDGSGVLSVESKTEGV